jgi:hypothetical protein
MRRRARVRVPQRSRASEPTQREEGRSIFGQAPGARAIDRIRVWSPTTRLGEPIEPQTW